MPSAANSTPETETSQIMLADNTNPLRQFRSYSYHFFLVACESTAVLDYLSSEQATNAFERSAFNLTNPRDVITSPYGNYVIVIDSRHDVDIVIEDVQWGTTFVGDQNSSGSSVALNVVMTDGTINFMEPRGVNFLNILANLGDQLDVDMICMPFCLKTVFYGHTESGMIVPLAANSDAQPLGFVPVDIVGQVDERGTSYKMDICGVINGIIHNPSYNAIVDNVSFPVTTGQTLQQHLTTFAQKIQTEYNEQRKQVKQLYSQQIDISDAAQLVYQFNLEPSSEQLQYLNDFGTNQPDQLMIENGVYVIKGTKEGGIPEVIAKLMTSSQQWVKVAAQGDPPDAASIDNTSTRYTFKVTQEFISTSPSISANIVTANITVSEYRYDTVPVISTPAGQTAQQPVPKIDPSQVITFDYIFTGKNVDILGMELNLSMGLALLQTLATSKSITNQGVDTLGGPAILPSTVANAAPNSGGFNRQGKVRKGTPIFAPLQWAASYLKDMNDIQNTATAEAVWKNFATYQSVNTAITIHGNPLLLAKVIDPDRSVPNYVKINIKMPTTPDDIWEYDLLNGTSASQRYYQDFWYTGYYLIVSATNKFSGGLFTQELELVSLPQTSTAQGAVSANETTSDTQQNVRARLLGQSATTAPPSTTSATPTAPVTPANTTSSSGKLATPTSNPASSTHQQFVANYWNYALEASETSGIAPDFTLAQAAIETGWGTNSFSQNYSTFFNPRAYGKPNGYWTGAVIPGTNTEAGTMVPPFRAYDGPTNSFLDQYNLLSRLYPVSASATDINTYANGLNEGKGGRQWNATNPSGYPPSIVAAYNEIQGYKSTLGIQNGQLYAGGPTPSTMTPQTNYLAVATPTSTPSTASSTTTIYATARTVEQASIAQKAPVFA